MLKEMKKIAEQFVAFILFGKPNHHCGNKNSALRGMRWTAPKTC
jgi:hypothetical protein